MYTHSELSSLGRIIALIYVRVINSQGRLVLYSQPLVVELSDIKSVDIQFTARFGQDEWFGKYTILMWDRCISH